MPNNRSLENGDIEGDEGDIEGENGDIEMKEILGLRFIKYHSTSCICGIENDHEIDS